jgi:hypothetical protein
VKQDLDEGLRVAGRVDPNFVDVRGHGAVRRAAGAAKAAGGVARATRADRHLVRAGHAHCAQGANLPVADITLAQRGRRFHRHQRQDLQHVALQYVAQRAGPAVEAGASL